MIGKKVLLTLLGASLLLPGVLPGVGWGAEAWDTTFEASPGNNDASAAGAGKIRATRSETGNRASVEHFWGDNDDTDDDNGLHRLGSARCFISDSAPTILSDSSTEYNNTGGAESGTLSASAVNSAAAAANDIGHGRCWLDSDDNYKMYIYVGDSGWQETASVSESQTAAQVIVNDDELLEGSFNYLYNGSFDITDGTGDASATAVPAGWAPVTSPTYSYNDPSTDTRWGDGFEAVITNAGTTNEGIQQTLTNLPSDTVFKVIARAKDDGTAVCTLDVTNEGGTEFTSDATTTDTWETLSGTFGTTVGSVDTVEITLVTTGADTQVCTWDHVGVFQVGDVATDRDEIPPPSFLAIQGTYSGTAVLPAASGTDVPSLSANFTPPSGGWIVEVGATINIGCANNCSVNADDGATCELQLGGTGVTGTVSTQFFDPSDSADIAHVFPMSILNINPTAGTELVYTVECFETDDDTDAIFNHNSNESNLWLLAHPPH